jgi:hypothetical protein
MPSGGLSCVRGGVLAVIITIAALTSAGCGRGGANRGAAVEREADAALINTALARELATVNAYGHAISLPGAAHIPLLRRFRAQDQEHVDLLMKVIRGFGATIDEAKIEGERRALVYSALKGPAGVLALLYERENKSVAATLNEVSKLSTPGTRSLLSAIGANQAEHLVLLRQALGAGPLAAVPEAFETGARTPQRAAAALNANPGPGRG